MNCVQLQWMISGSYRFCFLKIFCYQYTEYLKILGNGFFHNCPKFLSYLMTCLLKLLEPLIFFKSRMHKEIPAHFCHRWLYQHSTDCDTEFLHINTFFYFMNLKPVVLRCTFVAFWGIHTSAAFLDNGNSDAAITMGMVLLNEAATSKGDVGKRRSKLYFIAKVMLGQLEDTAKLQVNIWLSFQMVSA